MGTVPNRQKANMHSDTPWVTYESSVAGVEIITSNLPLDARETERLKTALRYILKHYESYEGKILKTFREDDHNEEVYRQVQEQTATITAHLQSVYTTLSEAHIVAKPALSRILCELSMTLVKEHLLGDDFTEIENFITICSFFATKESLRDEVDVLKDYAFFREEKHHEKSRKFLFLSLIVIALIVLGAMLYHIIG